MESKSPESGSATIPASASVQVVGEEPIDEAITDALKAARTRITIVAPRLHSFIFRRPMLRELLVPIVTGDSRNEIRILISEQREFMQHNGVIVNLARRVPDRMEIRATPDDLPLNEELIVIVDAAYTVHVPDLEKSEGIVYTEDVATAQTFQERIKPWWDRSGPVAELIVTGL